MYFDILVHFLVLTICLPCFVVGSSTSYLNSTKNSSSLIQPEFNSRNFEYKGVALGGWLVLEPYITPSLFLEFNKTNKENDIPVDEYHYCKKLGYDEAKKRLIKHWDSFYTESDFAKIKDYGLNMVRIPIGYWAFETLRHDPYVPGAQEYLDKAIGWAHKYELKVWVDLHGVPGSQNGFDNSGLRNIDYPGWFNSTENLEVTNRVLHKIFLKYGGYNMSMEYKDTILGIEIVNEPLSPKLSLSKLKKFYMDSYKDARHTQVVNNTLVYHDAFRPIGYWNDFFSYSGNRTNSTLENYNILVDHHHYEVFSSETLKQHIDGHLQNIKSLTDSIKKELVHHPAVVGEWLAALTDCTPWLNGVGLGTRYEGTSPYTNDKIGSCADINNWSKWSNDKRKDYRKFVEMQLDQFSNINGWIFWCFKTETSIEWDFQRLVELKIMPQPLSERKYIINGDDIDKKPKKGMGSNNYHLCISSIFIIVLLQIIDYIID